MMTKFDEWYLRFGGNGAMMQLSSVRRKAHGLLSFQRNDKEGSKKIRISEKCVCYCEASALISQKYGKTNTKEYLAKKKDLKYNEYEVQQSQIPSGLCG